MSAIDGRSLWMNHHESMLHGIHVFDVLLLGLWTCHTLLSAATRCWNFSHKICILKYFHFALLYLFIYFFLFVSFYPRSNAMQCKPIRVNRMHPAEFVGPMHFITTCWSAWLALCSWTAIKYSHILWIGRNHPYLYVFSRTRNKQTMAATMRWEKPNQNSQCINWNNKNSIHFYKELHHYYIFFFRRFPTCDLFCCLSFACFRSDFFFSRCLFLLHLAAIVGVATDGK